MIDWDQVKESLRVDEALDSLGFVESSRRNRQIWCSCQLPSHAGADRKPSFNVNEDNFLWNCYSCGEGGLFPQLVMIMLRLDWDSACDWLVPFSDASTDEDVAFIKQIDAWLRKPERPEMKSRSTDLPYFSERVLEPYSGLGEAFWEGRGVSKLGVHVFGLGYDEERHRGDYCGPAALIPHRFGGKLVGYQERWVNHGTEGFPKWVPKYTNSSDFPKKETLFNYDRALSVCRSEFGFKVVVVEGIMTVIRLWQIGVPAVATFGASMSDTQLRLLSGFVNGIDLSYDNDDAGTKAIKRALGYLSDLSPCGVIPPPKGAKADLGDLSDDDMRTQLSLVEPGFLWVP